MTILYHVSCDFLSRINVASSDVLLAIGKFGSSMSGGLGIIPSPLVEPYAEHYAPTLANNISN